MIVNPFRVSFMQTPESEADYSRIVLTDATSSAPEPPSPPEQPRTVRIPRLLAALFAMGSSLRRRGSSGRLGVIRAYAHGGQLAKRKRRNRRRAVIAKASRRANWAW